MENKITYPNEFTYAPPTLPDENGHDWWEVKKRNDKAREKYRANWASKIKELTPYYQNSILGDVIVLVNKDFICMEVTCNHTLTSRGGSTSEGYRKKFVGKHITEIRDMFASIKEFNFCSGKTIQLKQQRHQVEISKTITNNSINEMERKSGTTKLQLEVLTEKIKKFNSEIEELTKLIEAETQKEFPTI
jgi:hypothetical protein